jgi:hypothetical protein
VTDIIGRSTVSQLEEEEAATFEEDDGNSVPPGDIVAYNELRSCADIFRMYRQGVLDISPEFQRDVVWPSAAQTRFIDSLVKQLPIPSMCFALDYRQGKWIVIDGLQRISSIVRFLSGKDWKLSRLDDIDPALSGLHVSSISDPESKNHHFYAKVENLTIPITVLRCDLSKRTHEEFLFTIFHRLNTGGMKLNNQEIRNCIYGGSLNNFLKSSDQYPKWRKLNRMKSGSNYRFTKQELILRFFAFHDCLEKYDGHLAKFLNAYMSRNKNPGDTFLAEKDVLFKASVDKIVDDCLEGGIPRKVSTTFLEAVLVGIGRNLTAGTLTENAMSAYHELSKHTEFGEDALSEGLSKKNRVISRLQAAISSFSSVP